MFLHIHVSLIENICGWNIGKTLAHCLIGLNLYTFYTPYSFSESNKDM